MSVVDYYDLLGVDKMATSVQLRTAFKQHSALHKVLRRLSEEDHEEHYKKICVAFAVLSHVDRRAAYDESRRCRLMALQASKATPTSGNDSQIDLTKNSTKDPMDHGIMNANKVVPIRLIDVLKGCYKEVSHVSRTYNADGDIVKRTQKLIRVSIPVGSTNMSPIVVRRVGDRQQGRAHQGDVTFWTLMLRHPDFRVEGRDLVLVKMVDKSRLKTGGVISTKDLKDDPLHFAIDKNTPDGHELLFRGLGLPSKKDSRRRGNLIVQLREKTTA